MAGQRAWQTAADSAERRGLYLAATKAVQKVDGTVGA
jgi:hypothetical protein